MAITDGEHPTKMEQEIGINANWDEMQESRHGSRERLCHFPFTGANYESACKSLRSRSPSCSSTSTAACVFFHMGTARRSSLRPFAVSSIKRPRRSAGSAVILTKLRRCRGFRAAVKVVRSIARSEATAVIPGGLGRFKESSKENCPCVRPMGRSASSKRRAKARAALCT
jgi:hypothetical protein